MTSWIKNQLCQNKNTIIILRHAARDEMEPGSFGDNIPISSEGQKSAELLGESLSKISIGEIHTSPIMRCVQTAESIIKGAGQKPPISPSKFLGAPGPFIADAEKSGPFFLKNPLEAILRGVADGTAKIPGMLSLIEGGKLFFNFASQLKKLPCLMISHDSIICLLCCYCFQSIDIQKYLPGFLEGFSINFDPHGVSVTHCHGIHKIINCSFAEME